MPVLPTIPTFINGPSDSSQMNQLRDALNFIYHPPIGMLRQTSVQAVTTAVWTAVNLDSEDVDSDVDSAGGHSTSSNTSRFTARYPGWHDVGGGNGFAANATGVRGTYWAVNGIIVNGSQTLEATISGLDACFAARSIHVYLAIGDYLELYVYQSSGGNLNTGVTTGVQPSVKVRWVASN